MDSFKANLKTRQIQSSLLQIYVFVWICVLFWITKDTQFSKIKKNLAQRNDNVLEKLIKLQNSPKILLLRVCCPQHINIITKYDFR